VAVAAQALDQGVAVDPLDRRFAGGVDVGHDDHVGVIEAGAELGHQVAQPGEAVRLDHGDDLGVRGTERAAVSTAAISTGWWA
jgi:hypothetical protein